MNKMFVFFLTTIFFASSCSDSCNSDITGIYINKFRQDETHFLKVYEGNTYVLYHRDFEGQLNVHSGTYKYFKENCELLLDNWFFYDDYLPNDWQPLIHSLKVNNDNLEMKEGEWLKHGYFLASDSVVIDNCDLFEAKLFFVNAFSKKNINEVYSYNDVEKDILFLEKTSGIRVERDTGDLISVNEQLFKAMILWNNWSKVNCRFERWK